MRRLTNDERAAIRITLGAIAPELKPGDPRWQEVDAATMNIASKNPELTPKEVVERAVQWSNEGRQNSIRHKGIEGILSSRAKVSSK